MITTYPAVLSLAVLLSTLALPAEVLPPDCVKTANGVVQGLADAATGVRTFKGIPFAAPPVGELRWQPPQPVQSWQGIRQTVKFGPRTMQRHMWDDMIFRSDGVSEDCLYLNVWTPAKSAKERLPVLVYFYGGGFVAGDGSESRYDGASMARRGIVSLTVNYRLNVFGFLAHPGLTKESPHHASGNYGLLDQCAALLWVRQNIAAFGGDPGKVTIAGESAGSISVSALMASPLSKNLFARAIGESGSVLGALPPVALADAERAGTKFAAAIGASSLAELRAMPAERLLEASARSTFPMAIDGYFLPKDPPAVFAAGQQSHVPLLLGWNSEEMNSQSVLGRDEPTPANLANAIRRLYGEHAAAVLKVYAAQTPEEALARIFHRAVRI